MKQKHGTSRVRVTTFDGVTENFAAEGEEYRPKVVPITHTPVDEEEALMRVEFIANSRAIRSKLNTLIDSDYLFSPNLSLEDTQRITMHLRDAVRSIEAAICYVRPADPKWEDEQ